jgi:hypothetical protein
VEWCDSQQSSAARAEWIAMIDDSRQQCVERVSRVECGRGTREVCMEGVHVDVETIPFLLSVGCASHCRSCDQRDELSPEEVRVERARKERDQAPLWRCTQPPGHIAKPTDEQEQQLAEALATDLSKWVLQSRVQMLKCEL